MMVKPVHERGRAATRSIPASVKKSTPPEKKTCGISCVYVYIYIYTHTHMDIM